MPKIDQTTKAERKERVFLTLRRYPLGLKVMELAEITGFERRTLDNYLDELNREGKVYKEDNSTLWLALPWEQAQLRKLEMSPEEAMTLYLAARLFTKQHDKRNEPAETALMKLATALTSDARVGHEIHEAALELAQRPDAGEYNQIFRAVMQAYIYRRVLHITYEPGQGRAFETDFSPFLLEPSTVGFTTYAIGHSSVVNAWRTYKLERIRAATLTRQEYRIPPDFPGLDILRSAWSIMWGEEVETVVLRFSPTVYRRVMETRWHPSETKEDDPEKPGHLRWSAQVADTLDMLPWVRGWGADVEVLEPKELREELMGEAKRLMRVYGRIAQASDKNTERILSLWGKTKKGSQNPQEFHPAVFHMLDVGNVAHELLGERASPRWRSALADAFNVAPESLADWLPYVIALHDIGKTSSAFQSLNKEQLARLRREGFTLNKAEMRHEHITQIYLESSLPQMFGDQSSKWPQIASESLGGHHGSFAHPDNDIKAARRQLNNEPEEWEAFRRAADTILQNELLKRKLTSLASPSNVSTAIMALTGFAILCDWLGSDERYFPLSANVKLENYIEQSRNRAARAARESGLLTLPQSDASTQVQSLFSDLIPLRPLQLAIDDIPDEILQSPSLTIIEAPTGEGKTEAALALAHRIARITGTDELYYALPTMATSNQMFERLQTHLEKRLGLAASVKLVHGQAYLMEEELLAETPVAAIQPLENGETQDDSEASTSVAWFNSKKRALIAPFGVGTIDQAELAALNVKHAALRMMGLVGKVVIVDEVHAYDTYMTTVIERLLRWLAMMHTSVILLSATLPKSRRKKLAAAYNAELDLTAEQQDAYPSLLVLATGKNPHFAKPEVWQPNRVIELRESHFGDDAAAEKAKWLLDAVANGGCGCWITNTVKRAQRIFDVLGKSAPLDVDLQLLHSQFPLDERQRREDNLKGKYSREGKRPAKGIVVGTQVLEQSLDLDFDVMVSDLAPIDLLLQRAGRLHRHERLRPITHTVPRLWLNFETTPNSDLKLGTDRTIYDEFIMRQTRATLAEQTRIQLPSDYRALIETVYGDKPPSKDSPMYRSWKSMQGKCESSNIEAQLRLLPPPHPRDSFAQIAVASNLEFVEDESRADWIVAQTRLGERALNVIPLEYAGDFILLGKEERINVRAEASREMQRCLLRRHLRISNQSAIDAILKEAEKHVTELFAKSALLKGFYPLWLTNGRTELPTEHGKLKITLDSRLGLVIEKEDKANDADE